MNELFNKITFGRIVINILLITFVFNGIIFLIPAHTNTITDSGGNIVSGSIAEMGKEI